MIRFTGDQPEREAMTLNIHAKRKAARPHKPTGKKKIGDFTDQELAALPREEYLKLLTPTMRKHIRAAWAASDKTRK